jgi:hypothetical protein
LVSYRAYPPKKVRFSVRVWSWFNFNAKADMPLEYSIRQITNMSEEEFEEVVDEEFVPGACARFGEGPITFVNDFDSSAIPSSVYEWFPNFKIDQFPPKSSHLSPYSIIWSSIRDSLNRDYLRPPIKNADDLWENIEMFFSASTSQKELWESNIKNLQENIAGILKKAP